MLKAGLQPLEPYKNALSKWKCLHLPCGEIVYPKYNMIQSGRGGCKACGYKSNAKKQRLTQTQVNLRLKKKGLIALETYLNSSTPLKCKCVRCGSIQIIKFDYINKVHGCAVCARKIGGMKIRVSQEKAMKIMAQLDLEPLEPYVLSEKKWKCKCLRCGNIVFPTYADASQGKRGCKKCGYESSSSKSRISQDAASKIFEKVNLKPLEQYKSLHTPWKSRCMRCKKIVKPTLASVKFQNSGCRFCAPNSPVSPKQAVSLMKKASLKPLEPFEGSDRKWKCECLRCHRIVFPTYSKIKQGQFGCKNCGYRTAAQKNRTPEVEAIRIMNEAMLKPLEPYKGDGVKWKCRCLKCKNIVFPMLTNIKQKNGGCLFCANRGIDFNKPAYLYLLTHEELFAHKIGIGNSGLARKNDRISRFQKYGWKLYRKWDFDSGSTAHKYEQSALKHIRKELELPPYLSLDMMSETGGHSETVGAESISLKQLEKLIIKIIKG